MGTVTFAGGEVETCDVCGGMDCHCEPCNICDKRDCICISGVRN